MQLYQNLKSDKINKVYENKQYFNICYVQSNFSEENGKVKKLFELIGNGIVLTIDREQKKIKLDNLSGINVYWTCPGLFCDSNQLDEKKFIPNRLKPTESNIIYDYDLIKLNEKKISNDLLLEFHVINISFGKYWGYNFKTKSLIYCPYWVNISVNFDYFR